MACVCLQELLKPHDRTTGLARAPFRREGLTYIEDPRVVSRLEESFSASNSIVIVAQQASTLCIVHFLRSSSSIKPIMLRHKHKIKADTHIPQTKFYWIPHDPRPISLQARIYNQLCNRQHSAYHIKQHVPDTPTHSRLPLVVQPCLRNILGDCDD